MPLVIKKTDGRVVVMRVLNGADPEAMLERWKTDNHGQYVRHVDLAEDAIPSDRSQRNAWTLTDGDVVQVDPSLVAIPQTVARRQAKAALLLAGKLDAVQPAIDAITDATERRLIQIEWDESLEFERSRPSLIAMATAIGLDAAALDQLFITAATL